MCSNETSLLLLCCSVNCRTRPKAEGSVLITLSIRGADGTQQDSSGEVSFVYRVRIPHPPLTLPPSQLIMTSEHNKCEGLWLDRESLSK